MLWLTVCLPLFLSLVGYVVHRHLTDPFSAVPYSLRAPEPLSVNSLLLESAVHHSSLLSGPESIAVHPTDSSLWTGCYDGSLVRVSTEDGFEARVVSYTGWAAVNDSTVNVSEVCGSSLTPNPWLCGRPLGLLFRTGDELLVADGYHGLLLYSLGSSTWQSLWNDSTRDTNSVALDSTGDTVYFTSASSLYRNHRVLYDITSGHCTGSVWQLDLNTRAARMLIEGLCFANGILVHRQRLIVAETTAGRLLSFDRQHTDTQQVSVVIDSDRLPCLPDNLHFDKHDKSYWVGCGGPIRASGTFDLHHALGSLPTLRRLLVYLLPYAWLDSFVRAQAMVVRVRIVNDSWHEVSDVLSDPSGDRLQSTTSAVWRAADDRLYFASFRPVSNSSSSTHPLSTRTLQRTANSLTQLPTFSICVAVQFVSALGSLAWSPPPPSPSAVQ